MLWWRLFFVCVPFFFSFSFLKPKLTTWKPAKSELACWRSSFQLPVTLFLSMIASAVLWFSYSPKNCVLMLTMRGKQWGMWVGGWVWGGGGLTKFSRGLRGKPHSPNSFHSSAAEQQLLQGCAQERLTAITDFSFFCSLWVKWEPLDGKPRESEEAPLRHRRHLLHHSSLEWDTFAASSWWACLLWVMCHYDSSTNQRYTGLWQMVEF